MDPSLIIAIIGAALGPIAGLVAAVILDRRTKSNSSETTRVAAREAATHEFEAITTGYTEYTEKLQKRADKADDLEQRLDDLERALRQILAHLEVVEALVPAGMLPPRPEITLRKRDEERES